MKLELVPAGLRNRSVLGKVTGGQASKYGRKQEKKHSTGGSFSVDKSYLEMNDMTRKDLMDQFQNYPDVVEVTDLCAMLGGIKDKNARQLLQAGKIKSFLIGRKYQIPKECVIDYLLEDHSNENHAESNVPTQGDLEKAKGSLKKSPKQSRQTTNAPKGTDSKASARPITQKEAYRLMLQEYPDVMNIEQVSKVLGVSTKAVYGLIKGGHLSVLKIGRTYRIPKIRLVAYLYDDPQGQSDEKQK